jgi:type IX secretion system PorP/SprF family membrane protein
MMKGNRIYVVVICFFGFWSHIASHAQQIPVYALHELSSPGFNPSYAALEELKDLMIISRQQWVGFEGAPRSYYTSLNFPLKAEDMGIGMDLRRESSGPMNRSAVFVSYGYSLKISPLSRLSFGLRGGLQSYRIQLTGLDLVQQGDLLFQEDIRYRILPNVGTGLHFSYKNYYIDLSAPTLLKNRFTATSESNSSDENKEDRIVFLQAGGDIVISEDIILQPSIVAWNTSNAPGMIDLRVGATLKDSFHAGIAYRLSGALSSYISISFMDKYLISYAYELPLSYNYMLTTGTHEIAFGIDFEFLSRKTLSPRRF